MITHLRVKNYRGLRDVSVALGNFHVLVGPNGSGKSTFLDAVAFLQDCLKTGLREAVRKRASSLDELTFGSKGGQVQIAVEFDLSEAVPARRGFRTEYCLSICSDPGAGLRIKGETLTSGPAEVGSSNQEARLHPRILVEKDAQFGRDSFLSEAPLETLNEYRDVFDRFSESGLDQLSLAQLPTNPKRYPTASAVRALLMREVHLLNFIPREMARPCPALEPDEFLPDGHNLARVAGRLLKPKANGNDFNTTQAKEDWLYHLRLALPDLEDISWAQRPDDRAEYLKLHYRDGLVVPTWALSEGTLRMLGLTLPAFLPAKPGMYLVEEPENAVHPHALEVIINALRAIPQSQVLVTTHSPLLVDLVGKQPLLIFGKQDGAVTITPGDQHPALANWDRSPALSSVFSAGYLQ